MNPSERLAELSVTLPEPTAPIGSYVAALRTGNHILTSGQLPMRDGKLVYAGKVPDDVTLEEAADGARLAAIAGLAAIAQVAGGIDKVRRVVRVGVFVNSSPGFTAQSKVANGASDFLAQVFGEASKHVRAAVGVAELPINAAVEVELMVEA